MITLKIREKGFFIEMPGVAPFRTPADVNITHMSMALVVSHLHSIGIEIFEIISDTPGKERKFTEKDFLEKEKVVKKNNIGKRLKQLEKSVQKLISKKDEGHTDSNKEQITDKLETIERLSQAILDRSGVSNIAQDKPIIEELDTFIPNIDVDGIQLKGSSKSVIAKEEDDTDETADLLSSLTGGKKK
jgi:hypothetical protein